MDSSTTPMRNAPSVYLCGMPGAGKSTLGKDLSSILKYPFLDTDSWIEQTSGKSIKTLFLEGEETFRNVERQALSYVSTLPRHVVALGGGSLQNQEIVKRLKTHGILIFIDVPVSVLLNRLSDDQNRPLLRDRTESLKERLEKLYKQRLPLYMGADFHFQIPEEHTSEETAIMIRDTLLNAELL